MDDRPATQSAAPTRRASSSSRSTRSPTAARASPARTATSSSSPAALPGDRVRAELTKAKRDYAEARAVELLEPSPDRVADRCVHGGEPCPGAPWQGLPYERQLAEKQEQVDDALRRLGGLEGFELEPIEPAVEQWRYRNKLEYSFGERDGELVARLPRPRPLGPRSSTSRTACSPPSATTRPATRSATGRAPRRLPAYDRAPRTGVLRNLVVREGRRTGQLQTRLVTSPAEFPRPPVDLHTVDRGRRPAAPTARPACSATSTSSEELCGLRFRISPRRLLPDQHRDGRAPLRDRRRVSPASSGGERVFDLYCGIGTIGLTLAAGAGEVWGVEIVAGGDRRRRGERARSTGSRTPASSPATRGSGSAPLLERGRPARRRRRRPAPRRASRRRSCAG